MVLTLFHPEYNVKERNQVNWLWSSERQCWASLLSDGLNRYNLEPGTRQFTGEARHKHVDGIFDFYFIYHK